VVKLLIVLIAGVQFLKTQCVFLSICYARLAITLKPLAV